MRRGALSIEWIALITILCVGIVGALGVVRNALIQEFHELTDTICEPDIVGSNVEPELLGGPHPPPPGGGDDDDHYDDDHYDDDHGPYYHHHGGFMHGHGPGQNPH